MDFTPVTHILGRLITVVGLFMFPSAIVDAYDGGQSGLVFLIVGSLTMVIGAFISLATSGERSKGLTVRQSFLLTTGAWTILPIFGAAPFIFGAPQLDFVNAYFEAVSGMTTTGATIMTGIEYLPRGVLLWRGILQWLGGLGIVIVAMIFLPAMRVGGMQFFLTEGFDTLGKILPRALDIAKSLLYVYILLTVVAALAYIAFGMSTFEGIVHAFTTISTGGFSTSDASFARYSGPLEYVSSFLMILASLPFIRFVQLTRGSVVPLYRDIQVRAYLRWIFFSFSAIAIYHWFTSTDPLETVIRESLFNLVTLFSGTGFVSVDITTWGAFPLAVAMIVGVVGGCTGSTACSAKVFRWLVVLESIKAQIRRIHYPNVVSNPRLDGKPLNRGVIDSVGSFFTLFFLTLGITAVLLSLTGLSNETALTAAWTSVANIGPAYGPDVGPSGAMDGFPAAAKWIMIFGMLAGRLEILSVFVLFTASFWRE
ncbi:MAG: TrkH family potassium uptake protein [Alphaproteobacteria bacterium]|nr:TrkH family potassium uptake protein [Alphaproteobacteria bacterium]